MLGGVGAWMRGRSIMVRDEGLGVRDEELRVRDEGFRMREWELRVGKGWRVELELGGQGLGKGGAE